MKLTRAEFVTAENRELLPPDIAPIERYLPCQKCGKPVDTIEGPSATITGFYADDKGQPVRDTDGKPVWSITNATHPNGCPE